MIYAKTLLSKDNPSIKYFYVYMILVKLLLLLKIIVVIDIIVVIFKYNFFIHNNEKV